MFYGVGEMMTAPDVKTLVASFKGRKVFFDPLWGNNGDKLITMGSRKILRECGTQLVRSPKRADVIVINGGASMTSSLWQHGLKILLTYASTYNGKILVVLPQSWEFNQTEFRKLILNNRAQRIYLYARERYSYELLKQIMGRNIYIGLDHDMAFHLDNSSFLASLKSKARDEHILIVERGDRESATGLQGQSSSLIPLISKVIPAQLRSRIPMRAKIKIVEKIAPLERVTKKAFHNQTKVSTPFYQSALELVAGKHHSLTSLPVHYADISLPTVCSFREFALAIARADIVITTRLHVGILSALLGKPTYLKQGPWHKIKGVYEYSLKRFDWVRLL